METQMVQPCEICGSNGSAELIETCSKCRMARQHIYCMRDFAGERPEIWICEECTSGEGRHGEKKAFQSGILKGSSKSCNDKTKHEPCEICGSNGSAELIETCCKCRMARQHIYCMRDFAGERPANWICEECTSGEGKHGEKEAFQSGILKGSSKSRNNMTKHEPLKVQKTRKVKFLDAEEVIKLESQAAKRGSSSKNHSRYRSSVSSASEKLPSPERRSSLKVNCSSRPGLPSDIPKFSSSMAKPNQRFVPADQQASQVTKEKNAPVNPAKGSSTKALETASPNPEDKGGGTATTSVPGNDVGICDADAKKTKSSTSGIPSTFVPDLPATEPLVDSSENRCKERDVLSAKQAESVSLSKEKAMDEGPSCRAPPSRLSSPKFCVGSSSCTDTEKQTSDAQKGDQLHFLPKLLSYRPYLPALDVTWRGCFKSVGENSGSIFGFVEAKLASRVNRKAYENSKDMPMILEIQLLPQCYALADLFHDDLPGIQDIALYFFPMSEYKGSEEKIQSLVDRLETEKSVIRSFVAGVELLILSPKLLHGDSQELLSRACTRPFLWGVFYNPKGNKFCKRHAAETVSPTDSNKSTDMDIDMLGGQSCGTTDIAVSKASSSGSHGEPCKECPSRQADLPPGFEAVASRRACRDMQ